MHERNGFLHGLDCKQAKPNDMVLHNMDPFSYNGGKPTIDKMRWKLMIINRFGICYFWTISFSIFFMGYYILMPVVYHYSEDTLWRRRLMAVYMLMTSSLNNILTVYYHRESVYRARNATARLTALPDGTWSRCDRCDQVAPPRCHHCVICQQCILKRDHHCYFTGVCIGSYNQRHFLALCLHAGVSLLYGFYICCYYFVIEYRQPISLSWYHFVLPVAFVEMVLGYVTVVFFVILLLTYLTICTAGGAVFLFMCGIYLALNDLTPYEFGSKQFQHRNAGSWIANLRAVFGPFGFIQLVIPMPFLPIPDTGTSDKANIVKNI